MKTEKKPPESTSEYLSINDVAARLKVCTATAYSLVNKGTIPALRVRGLIRIPRTQFLAWIAENSTGSAAPTNAA